MPKVINTKLLFVLLIRKTWLGIPEKNRPLKNRLNIVMTSDEDFKKSLPPDVLVAKSIEDAIQLIHTTPEYSSKIETIMVVGGVQLFEETLLHPLCTTYHLTMIDTEFPCDTYLTDKTIDKLKSLEPVSRSEPLEENGMSYIMNIYNPNP